MVFDIAPMIYNTLLLVIYISCRIRNILHTKAFGDEKELINVRLPGKEGLSSEHLREETSNSPNVYSLSVVDVSN